MSDIDPLAGCSPFCLLVIVLYIFYFWIPVLFILIGVITTALFRRPRQSYFLWTVAAILTIVLCAGLIGYFIL